MRNTMNYRFHASLLIIFLVIYTGSVGNAQLSRKITILKEIFKSGIKYSNIEEIKNFKDLLVGKWGLPPNDGLNLMSNGTFSVVNYPSNKIISTGLWKIEKNVLSIKHMNKEWESNTIEFVVFYDDSHEADKGAYNYTFFVVFQKQKSLGNVLVFESN